MTEQAPTPPTQPSDEPPPGDARKDIWLRGFFMLVLMILFSLAQTLMWLTAIAQFLWLLIARERNPFVAEFGAALGHWLQMSARFQAGLSEDKPFPFSRWGG